MRAETPSQEYCSVTIVHFCMGRLRRRMCPVIGNYPWQRTVIYQPSWVRGLLYIKGDHVSIQTMIYCGSLDLFQLNIWTSNHDLLYLCKRLQAEPIKTFDLHSDLRCKYIVHQVDIMWQDINCNRFIEVLVAVFIVIYCLEVLLLFNKEKIFHGLLHYVNEVCKDTADCKASFSHTHTYSKLLKKLIHW